MNDLVCFNHYFIEYLLVSDNIEKDISENKNLVLDKNFLKFLDYLIKYDKEENYLSKKMRVNLKKMFEFLDENLECKNKYYDSIKKNYSDYPESGRYYLNQLLIKYDNIEDYKNNSCVLWNINDIDLSVRYDFGFLIMILTDNKKYFDEYFYNLIDNQEFIYFAKRLLIQYPSIAYQIKQRIIDVLKINKEANYNLKDNDMLLEKYINLNTNYNTFLIANFIEEYNKIKIENLIINDEYISNPLIFDYIERYIDNMDDDSFSKSMKNSLFNILSKIKPNLSKNLINKYNELIIKINSKKCSNLDKNTIISANHIIEKYGILEYLKIVVKGEISDMYLTIENDLKIMDYIIGNIDISEVVNYDECYLTINRFIHENISIFKDPLVHSKLNELLLRFLNMDEVKSDISLTNKLEKVYKKINKLY